MKHTLIILLSLLWLLSCNVENTGPEQGDDPARSGPVEDVEPESEDEPETLAAPEAGEKELKDKFKGTLAYDIPDTMRVGNIERVELVVTSAQNVQVALGNISRPDAAVTDTVRLGDLMSAELVDFNAMGPEDKNFDISLKFGEEEQQVDLDDSTKTTKWVWAVKPLKAGINPLVVEVKIVTADDRFTPPKETYRTLDVYERKIHVVTIGNAAADNSSSWTRALLILVGVVILAGLGFLFGRRKKSESKIQAQEGDGKADPAEIKLLVRKGEIPAAIGELMDYVKLTDQQDYENELIALEARFSKLQKSIRTKTISQDDQEIEYNQITIAMMGLLDELESSTNA